MNHVLVSGSSGFVGSHLVSALRHRGWIVSGIDRVPPKPGYVPPDHFIHGDLCTYDDWASALKGIDEVIHLAAAKADWGLSEAEYMRDNLHATARLLEFGVLHGVKRFTIYSTVGVYGPSALPLTEEAAQHPDTPYGLSKQAAEKAVYKAVEKEPDLDVVLIRPSAIFGPGNPAESNVYRLISAIQKRRFVLVGDGSAVKTTAYIRNVVDATMFLLDRDAAPRLDAFNYVDEPVLTTRELADLIARVLAVSDRWPRFPLWAATSLARSADILGNALNVDFPITAARIEKFCRSTVYSGDRLRVAGFVRAYDPETAIRETVEWARANQW